MRSARMSLMVRAPFGRVHRRVGADEADGEEERRAVLLACELAGCGRPPTSRCTRPASGRDRRRSRSGRCCTVFDHAP